MRRIRILLPVSPRTLLMRVEPQRVGYINVHTSSMAKKSMTFFKGLLASSINTMALVMAPGPVINGITSGVTEMSET